METFDFLEGSNWFTLASLVLIVIIFFIRDGLPWFRKGKSAAGEVSAQTVLSHEDRELIREIARQGKATRDEIRGLRKDVSEVLIAVRVAAEVGRQGGQ